MDKIVKIFSDASYAHKEQIGTYAFSILLGDRKIRSSGSTSHPFVDSGIIETIALLNGLENFARYKNKVTKILIYIDNKSTIKHILNNIITNKYERRCVELLKSFKIDFELNHIKAHTSNIDENSLENKWCDETARKLLTKKTKTYRNRIESYQYSIRIKNNN